MWSTDHGTCGAPCRDGGQRSTGHPRSLDRAEGSQTYSYMHGIDYDRGSRVSVVEARKPKWLSDRGRESMYVCCGGQN